MHVSMQAITGNARQVDDVQQEEEPPDVENTSSSHFCRRLQQQAPTAQVMRTASQVEATCSSLGKEVLSSAWTGPVLLLGEGQACKSGFTAVELQIQDR